MNTASGQNCETAGSQSKKPGRKSAPSYKNDNPDSDWGGRKGKKKKKRGSHKDHTESLTAEGKDVVL